MSADHEHPTDPAAARRIAEAGRRAIHAVWRRRTLAGQLSEPERRLLAILERHPDYHPYFDGAEPPPDLNPWLHVLYHEVVQGQIAHQDPPEAAAAVTRLVVGGAALHEAEHRVMEILVREMYEMLSRHATFDRDRYVRRLEALEP